MSELWNIKVGPEAPLLSRPAPPFGPTQLEVLRSCGLRACFAESDRYPKKLAFAGRVGTVFHRVMEEIPSLLKTCTSPDGFIGLVAASFHKEAEVEIERMRTEVRSQWIEIDERRLEQAFHSAVSEARKVMQHQGWARGSHFSVPGIGRKTAPVNAAEIRLWSRERLFTGIIDRAQREGSAVVLVDYKSASRLDVPERYIRQLEVYAWLWNETYDEWPKSAILVYPFVTKSFVIGIDPNHCAEVVWEYVDDIVTAYSTESIESLAKPGEVCKLCDFRPWCRPFWKTQESISPSEKNRAEIGFTATLTRLLSSDSMAAAILRWNGIQVRMPFPIGRFPHLLSVPLGSRLRILDVKITGTSAELKAKVSGETEVYIITE